MSDLDQELLNLVLKAQKYQPRSKQRALKLNKVHLLIESNNLFCRPYAGQFGQLYEDIYSTAKQNLWRWFTYHINNYNPQRSPVKNYLNFLLNRRFFPEAIEEIMGNRNIEIIPLNITDLDNINPESNNSPLSLGEYLIESVRQDPDLFFISRITNKKIIVNFKFIFLQRNPQNSKERAVSWQELANNLGEVLSNISQFYQRGLKKDFYYLFLFLRYYYNLNDLPHLKTNFDYPSLAQMKDLIIEYVREDPDRIFKTKVLPSNPQINFQLIFLKHHNDHLSLSEIATQTQVNDEQLKTFYQKCLNDNFNPLFDYFS